MKPLLPRKLTEKLSAIALPLGGRLLQINGDDPTPYPLPAGLTETQEPATGIVLGAAGIVIIIIAGVLLRHKKAR